MPEITDDELAALNTRATAADSAVAAAAADAAALATGVASYRDRVAAMHPTIPGDAIAGDTFAAIDASFANAERIGAAAVAAITPGSVAASRVPAPPVAAGAAATPPDTSKMSPREKVMAGLTARESGSAAQV